VLVLVDVCSSTRLLLKYSNHTLNPNKKLGTHAKQTFTTVHLTLILIDLPDLLLSVFTLAELVVLNSVHCYFIQLNSGGCFVTQGSSHLKPLLKFTLTSTLPDAVKANS